MSEPGDQPLFWTPSSASARSRLRRPGPASPIGTGISAALGEMPLEEQRSTGGGGDDNDVSNDARSGGYAANSSGGSTSGNQAQKNQTPAMGQRGKFVPNTDVPDSQMLDIDVCLRKQNYGIKGDRAFNQNMEMATAALDPKFGVAKHRIVTSINDINEGNQTNFQHVQQSIVSIFH